MFQAIGAISQIYAAEFLKEAIRAELFVTNAKERLFWKAIVNGCKSEQLID